MRVGFYAGSFDPFTNGHLHVIERSAKLFDKVIVGLAVNSAKERRFPQEPMLKAMQEVFYHEGLDNVTAIAFEDLTVDVASKYGATFLIRGLRNNMDYEYEENISSINEEISGLDTVYFRAGKLGAISSSMIFDLLRYNRNIDKYIPSEVQGVIRAYWKKPY
ncbi:MAG: pantetheine-phosphate adenylyltransferase [Firmicutes bacterium]|nr:pantetheine-phosphate adenylyltransferase [Bacillota bacterium]